MAVDWLPKLPDLGLPSFQSDPWHFAAVCVVVIGVVVVPTYLWYRHAKRKNDQRFQIALAEAERKLEETRIRRQKMQGKGKKRWGPQKR